MREILFRGKTLNGNEWVIGAGVYKSEGYTWIITDDVTKTENRGTGSDAIIPETIGQYTGLTDKNRNKVFEGDIVKSNLGTYVVKYLVGSYCCSLIESEYLTMLSTIAIEKVIGNIHDNPELLGDK